MKKTVKKFGIYYNLVIKYCFFPIFLSLEICIVYSVHSIIYGIQCANDQSKYQITYKSGRSIAVLIFPNLTSLSDKSKCITRLDFTNLMWRILNKSCAVCLFTLFIQDLGLENLVGLFCKFGMIMLLLDLVLQC